MVQKPSKWKRKQLNKDAILLNAFLEALRTDQVTCLNKELGGGGFCLGGVMFIMENSQGGGYVHVVKSIRGLCPSTYTKMSRWVLSGGVGGIVCLPGHTHS